MISDIIDDISIFLVDGSVYLINDLGSRPNQEKTIIKVT
jgi:hypothetical protein